MRSASADRRFRRAWKAIAEAAAEIGAREDARWRKRRRLSGTVPVILFVFRIVFSGGRQGYQSTLCELWEQCRSCGIPLPQEHPPTAGAASMAREKLDASAFKSLHRRILSCAGDVGEPLWKGRRAFAVDGSKVNLPRQLLACGYDLPNEGAHYPQGMISVLYRKRANYDVGTLSDFAGFSLRRAVRKRGTGLRFRGPRSSDRRRTDPSIFSA